MREHFDVNRQHRCASLDKHVEVAVRLFDHQMDVERDGCDLLDRPHDRRANRDVGYEVAVHHVHVNEVRATAFDGRNVPRPAA